MSSQSSAPLPDWIVGEDPFADSDEVLYLLHQGTPGFYARCCYGPPPETPDSASRHFVDDDGGDALHIYDFTWSGEEPDDRAFEQLMTEAVKALDQWLENNSELADEHYH